MCWVWSDFEGESEGEGCRSPEGSDLAAEEGCEEGDSNAEEGHEGVWGEVHGDYDETVLCARSQASRSTTRPSLRKVSSVATLFIIIIPGVSVVVGCV